MISRSAVRLLRFGEFFGDFGSSMNLLGKSPRKHVETFMFASLGKTTPEYRAVPSFPVTLVFGHRISGASQQLSRGETRKECP
jgi:hypothetical protein